MSFAPARLVLSGSVACLLTVALPYAAASRPAPTRVAPRTVAAAPAAAPVNLLVGDTASLASGTGAWIAENGQVARVSSGVLSTTTATSGYSLTESGTATAASPGTVYTGTFSARAVSAGRQVVPYLYFYNSAGAVVDKVKGEVGQDTTDAWTPVTPVVGIAPTTATSVALVELTWGSVAGEAHQLTSPVLTRATSARTDVVGPLRTVGNQVYDQHGPIVLKGVNRIGLETSSTGNNLTAEDLGQAKRWGATLVRVPLSSSFWLSSNCHYDAAYASVVDGVVQQITQRGMVALLDLHTNTITSCGPVAQRPMADATATSFWTSVASRYRSNPLVAFDLYNEPHDISDAVWLRGGTVNSPAGTYQAVGMQQLYDAVRATGATNLTFISGNGWASAVPAQLVSGTNVVYGVHAYTCPVNVDATCMVNPSQPPPSLATWSTVSAKAPVVMTEFGWPAAGSGTYNSNMVAFLAAHGWGWTAFAWDGTSTGKFSLLSTAGPGASYQPSPAGMPVLTALTAG